MVFRNGGTLRRNEQWFYNGSRLETVRYYKYLGITFSTRLSWSPALKTLCLQSKRALIKINSIFGKCGDLPVSLGLELFDRLVVPILLYGSEVWGCEYRDEVELVHRKFCRILLGVSSRTPNDIVLGELGVIPLYAQYTLRCIKFWLKIVMSQGYINSSYNMLKLLDENGKRNWVSYVKNILISNGFGYVWLAQGVNNVNHFMYIFKQRMIDISHQHWFNNIVNTTMYCTYKSTLEPEIYLSEVMWRRHRVALARLRTGSNQLAVNKLRGQLPRYERLCKYCIQTNRHTIEDEYHLVMECPLYRDLRNTYLAHIVTIVNTHIFSQIMSSRTQNIVRSLAAYTYHAFKLHTNFASI